MHSLAKVRCRAIIVHNDKLLVVKNSRGSEYYALPGGHLDPGESPVECIERELEEELGIRGKVGRLLYVYTFTQEDKASVEFLFEITNGEDFLTHESQIKTHAHELSEVRWIDSSEELLLLPQEIHTHFKKGSLFLNETRFINGFSLDK